jgi:hypothetical protein
VSDALTLNWEIRRGLRRIACEMAGVRFECLPPDGGNGGEPPVPARAAMEYGTREQRLAASAEPGRKEETGRSSPRRTDATLYAYVVLLSGAGFTRVEEEKRILSPQMHSCL